MPAASSAPARSRKRLDASLAIIDKRRPAPNVSEVMNIVGDVKGKHAVIVDDIIDTAGTLTHAAEAIVNAGARERVGLRERTPVFSGKAVQRIDDSPLQHVVVTNTIPLVRGGSALSEGPREERRASARRGDQAHSSRRLDLESLFCVTVRREEPVMPENAWKSESSPSPFATAPVKGAARQLRAQGKVPGVCYGASPDGKHRAAADHRRRQGAARRARPGPQAEHRAST